MRTETIDHTTLSHLVEAGAVRGADVVGEKGGWEIVIKYGMTQRALASRRGHVRVFKRFETLVSYLKSIGVVTYQVNAANYEAEAVGTTKRRQDASERLKQAHEAAAHDKWFREQVEIGLQEADDPATEWVSHEDARASWAAKRAKLVKKAAA